ncbi:MAG: histidine phosphatase family protein [Vulcanimicrobiaceae bacterium]
MIYVARHGETTWNVAGRYQGRMESALSALGVRQGFALADHFAQRLARGEPVPTRILASPLLRCAATARFVGERLGVPVETDRLLIEIGHGTWEGRYRDEIAANDPERYRTWREDPAHVAFEGGEKVDAVMTRWREFAATLVAVRDDVLVVTHDAVVRCALLEAMDRPLADFWRVHVENAAFAVLHGDGRRLVLDVECSFEHLAEVRAEIAGQAL